MSRYSETLSNRGLRPSTIGERVNLDQQGPNGYLLDMAYGVGYTDYYSNPWVFKMVRAPRGFRFVPDGQYLTRAYKTLIEQWMQSWDGINRTLSNNVDETQIGHSGEVFQTPTKTMRARTNLTSTIVEKAGKPVITFLEDFQRVFIADPEVNHPLLSGINAQATDRLNDMFSVDLIAYEPDPTYTKVQNAVFLTNVFPINEIGENTGNRQIQQPGQLRTYNLQWACWQRVGYAVDRMAQSFMDQARVTGIDPGMNPMHINGVDSDIAAANRFGALEQIQQLKRQMITP